MNNKSKLSANAYHIAVLTGIGLSALLVSGIGMLALKYEWMMIELQDRSISLLAGISSFLSVLIIIFWMLYALFALMPSKHKCNLKS